ncbi:MAG: hypothetical protein KKC75_04540, partial [Nanoarchaeota archaeon]|nr:hypothetical protein [Nanoarchaeota archaeon]MBU1946945.1 hypothetical protein [Nanoarchaeota archaeon]
AAANTIRNGSWCPYCSSKRKLGIEDMHKIAKAKGGKCLSNEYTNNHINLKWQCEKGHVWEATPSNVERGTWCRICAITQRKERGWRSD